MGLVFNFRPGGTTAGSGVLTPGRYRLEARAGGVDGTVGFSFTLGGATASVSIGDAVGLEGTGAGNTLTFPVTLSSAATAPVTVGYGTSDGSAHAGSDYNVAVGTLTFAAGELSKSVTVQLVGDAVVELSETFQVVLSNPTNATLARAAATGTILNDDSAVDFDWTVPKRFDGLDHNGDGEADYFPPDGALVIAPSRWPVDFTYTLGATCPSGISDWWRINGTAVLTTSDPGVISDDSAACKFSYGFPAEGTYQVQLEIRDSTTGSVIATKQREVIVQDWLIVSLGDSVASGEGNPDVPGGASAQWENTQCHRSSFAGPARAAAQIENADPKTSVTFIHLACSGARIDVGLLGPYAGVIPGADLPPQVDAMKSLVGNREIDAALISIGANDVHFAKVVERCFIRPFCDQLYPGSGATLFESKLTLLPGKYGNLASRLTSLALPVAVPNKRYYITEYFDPTRDDTATPCSFPNGILFDHPATISGLFFITGAEATWASNNMMVRLNTAVTNAKALYGWTYVGGIRDAFLPHGYCATDHWVDRFRESQSLQGDQNGSLHPNHAGQNLYGTKINGSLVPDFYEGGDLTKPRHPATP